VTLLNAGQIAGLAFGLRDILNTTPEKRAERAKEKQKEQDQTVQDFLEICKKIKAKEKVPITGTLENIIPIVAQKSPEVEKKLKDFFEKLSKQEFEWNSIARETFKRIKDNPTINRQLIALEFTNLTLEQKKNLCLEIEKEFFSK
jgi:hypothetical protein